MDSKDIGELMKPGGYDADGREFISALPKSIKRRVQALKKLQVEGLCILRYISACAHLPEF